jgi:hypothetical protein
VLQATMMKLLVKGERVHFRTLASGGTVTIDGTEWQIEGIEAQTATLSALRLVAEGQHERTRAAYRRA